MATIDWVVLCYRLLIKNMFEFNNHEQASWIWEWLYAQDRFDDEPTVILLLLPSQDYCQFTYHSPLDIVATYWFVMFLPVHNRCNLSLLIRCFVRRLNKLTVIVTIHFWFMCTQNFTLWMCFSVDLSHISCIEYIRPYLIRTRQCHFLSTPNFWWWLLSYHTNRHLLVTTKRN